MVRYAVSVVYTDRNAGEKLRFGIVYLRIPYERHRIAAVQHMGTKFDSTDNIR